MTEASGTKINDEIASIMAETVKLNKTTSRWREVVILTVMVIFGIAIAKLFL